MTVMPGEADGQPAFPLQGNVVGRYLLRKRPAQQGASQAEEERAEPKLASELPHDAGQTPNLQVGRFLAQARQIFAVSCRYRFQAASCGNAGTL